MPETGPVRDVLDRLSALAEAERITLADVIESFGRTSFLPVMMVPAVLVVSPLSGIPLFSSVCGITIVFVALQMLIGRAYLWLPAPLMRRAFSGARVKRALSQMNGTATWVDGHAKRRLGLLVWGPLRKWIEALCIVCGGSMPALELVPFSSSLLGAAVLLFSAAMLTRDGAYAILGMALMALASTIPLAVYGVL